MITIEIQLWEEGGQILFRSFKRGVPATENEDMAANKMAFLLAETMQKYLKPPAPKPPPAKKRKRK